MLARIANAANALRSSRTIFVCNMHDKKKKSEQSLIDAQREGMKKKTRAALHMLTFRKTRAKPFQF